jgi:pimeloyl-ACP methyl ester carboxylesterase
MGIVGLGSGGSLALRFASREEAFRAAVLVSLPGLSDRGFDLTEDLKRLDGRSVLLVSDREGSGVAKDLQKFAAQYPDAKPLETRVTKEEGAGAALLKAEKGLDRALAGWIRDRLAPAKKE